MLGVHNDMTVRCKLVVLMRHSKSIITNFISAVYSVDKH